MENYNQGEVLGPNQGNKSCTWMDFRIAMDQWLLYCCMFLLFLNGSLLWLSYPVSPLYIRGVWEHITRLFSLQVFKKKNHIWGAVPKKLHLNFICTWTWFIRQDPGVQVDAKMELDFGGLEEQGIFYFAFGRNVNCGSRRPTVADYIFQR